LAEPTPKKKKAKGRKKEKRVLSLRGTVHVRSTFNNTIVSITDPTGAVVAWASSGKMGYKGSRKGTPFAAQLAAEQCAREVMSQGMKKVEVWVKGPGSGREAAIRSLQAAGLEVSAIKDVTLTPHNGCRPPKRRRV
jgi:small subunit ribosomal protein S11